MKIPPETFYTAPAAAHALTVRNAAGKDACLMLLIMMLKQRTFTALLTSPASTTLLHYVQSMTAPQINAFMALRLFLGCQVRVF